MFKKLLIASRGEIAVRIIRACKELGVSTVAVHSDVDQDSMHVRLADESVCIGSQQPQNSYLNIAALLSAAELTNVEAVHPGYGFLSENYNFAEMVTKHGIKFIGPNPQLIKSMGNKIEAKQIASKNGLPIIPGSEGEITTLDQAKKICSSIGFPILVKASGGGGGKGMKIVAKESDLENAMNEAKNEAKKYFNNDEVYIEKYFNNPRHIEAQILSDKNKTIHLGERDCSVQRRYQKLIEESPSPILTAEVRKDLLSKTVKMVEKIGYEGAGTVEFIYDDGKFYFLEMNTRIQVEHPVSEVVTGIDIVKEQISIAAKGYTSLNQTDIISRGHAIECRINAEDPDKNFQPSPGTISVCHQPSGFRTRIDGAIFQGCKISPYYDSLICKLICHGRNRTEAIQRTLRSLDEFVIEGITTTIDLHKKILNHQKFISSNFNVNWLNQEKFN
ncbi:MAG: acetyl-CoA carboxylase biotin carboxylase subunit [Candidatus Pelagibacter sp.]|jgi:acetyl-CoA carboxylase biotin carboxylase subunit|nr:acetyl-CoA carboxylase biotin carboxylase subunit [Candidatus Pelagibacter sp.]|tara:strand:- start:17475 stop:18812 length:1338 start_codon:yes stop_codon:yes gene_type:complete